MRGDYFKEYIIIDACNFAISLQLKLSKKESKRDNSVDK